MIAPPAMVEIAEAIWEPPCCSRIARPSETAPQTTRKPPRKVTQPDTRLMMLANMFCPLRLVCRVDRACGMRPRRAVIELFTRRAHALLCVLSAAAAGGAWNRRPPLKHVRACRSPFPLVIQEHRLHPHPVSREVEYAFLRGSLKALVPGVPHERVLLVLEGLCAVDEDEGLVARHARDL